MSAPFRETWPKLDCHYDDFIRTTEPDTRSGVGELWKQVEASGDLYLGSYEGWYCVGCEAYYTEKELEPGGICPLHKKPVERIREPTYFFKLAAYQDRLLEFYERHPRSCSPQPRINEVKSFVRGGLEDLSVSRTTFSWGVPVPDDPEHVMYVWFDALFNYYTPMLATPERRAFWPASVHLVGKDILRFHAVYWPAFSDVVRDVRRPDPEPDLRARLSHLQRPEDVKVAAQHRQAARARRRVRRRHAALLPDARHRVRAGRRLQLKDLVARYNAELGNALGNLLNRVLKQVEKLGAGSSPSRASSRISRRALFAELARPRRSRGRGVRRGAAASRARGHLAGGRRDQPVHRSGRALGGVQARRHASRRDHPGDRARTCSRRSAS